MLVLEGEKSEATRLDQPSLVVWSNNSAVKEKTDLVHELLDLGLHEGSDEGSQVEGGSTAPRRREGEGGWGGEVSFRDLALKLRAVRIAS